MAQAYDTSTIIEDMQREMLFAIKERITELARGTSAPVQLKRVVVRDAMPSHGESIRYYEIKNVYLDDSNTLCGDLAGTDDRRDVGVLFGKNIEALAVDDLKFLLDTLYGSGCSVDCSDCGDMALDRPAGLYGFLAAGKAGISRMLRR